MSYTTADAVSAPFLDFIRGGSNQLPADAQIQTWIDDAAGEIDAVLKRRFAIVISDAASFDVWIAALAADATALLEKLNRYSASAELGHALGTRVESAEKLAERLEARYDAMMAGLKDGDYDLLFDPDAMTADPRPGLKGIAGGDQPDTQEDRKSTRLNSSHMSISYAVFCLKKKITDICLLVAEICVDKTYHRLHNIKIH